MRPRSFRPMQCLATCGFIFAFGACATLKPQLEIDMAGHLDEEQSQRLIQQALTSTQTHERQIEVIDAQNTAFERKDYEILGTLTAELPDPSSISLRNAFWYHNYESRGLFGYCVWQMPLKIATLSLWNITPLAWPCLASTDGAGTPADRLAQFSRYARRITVEMGGDVALLVDTQEQQYIDMQGFAADSPGYLAPYVAKTETTIRRNTGATFLILRKRITPPSLAPQTAIPLRSIGSDPNTTAPLESTPTNP